MKKLEAKPKDFLRKANGQLKNKRKRKKEHIPVGSKRASDNTRF